MVSIRNATLGVAEVKAVVDEKKQGLSTSSIKWFWIGFTSKSKRTKRGEAKKVYGEVQRMKPSDQNWLLGFNNTEPMF
jgi:hypothetical protein